MLQLWVLPEVSGQDAGYQVHCPLQGAVTRIYGDGGRETFGNHTSIDVAMLDQGQEAHFDGEFLAYLSKGHGEANAMAVTDGDLLRGEGLSFQALEDVQLTVVQWSD